MPIIKSAKKRVRTARRAAARNARTKRALKASLKTLSKSPNNEALNTVQSNLDRAVKKHVIHKNKAARLKRRAAAQAKLAKVKTVPKKTASKTKSSAPKKAKK